MGLILLLIKNLVTTTSTKYNTGENHYFIKYHWAGLFSSKTCSKCSALIQPGDNFCKECGTPVGDACTENKVSCPYCNAELNFGDKFCTKCGKEIKNITSCPQCYADLEPGTGFAPSVGLMFTNIRNQFVYCFFLWYQ